MNKLLVLAAAAMISGCTSEQSPSPCTNHALAIIAKPNGLDKARIETRATCEKVGFEDCSEVRKELVELVKCYYSLTTE